MRGRSGPTKELCVSPLNRTEDNHSRLFLFFPFRKLILTSTFSQVILNWSTIKSRDLYMGGILHLQVSSDLSTYKDILTFQFLLI